MPAVSEEEGRARVVGMWHLFALLNATLVPGTRAAFMGDRPLTGHPAKRAVWEGIAHAVAAQREAI